MTSPWRPVDPAELHHTDPRDDSDSSRGVPSPDQRDTSAPDEFVGEVDGEMDLVWLGDANRGLDEFAPAARMAPVAAAHDDDWFRSPGANVGAVSSPFHGTPPPPPWRLRRVVLPALLVLAGVAVVSNLETQAPAPVQALPHPPEAHVSRPPVPEIRTAFFDPPLAPLPAAVTPEAPGDSPRSERLEPSAPLEPPAVVPQAPVSAELVPARPHATPPQSQTAARPTAPVSQTTARDGVPSPGPTAPTSVAAIAESTSRAPATPGRQAEPPATVVATPAASPRVADTPAPAVAEAMRPVADRAETPVAAAAPRREIETRAIQQVLGQYRAAFNSRDAGAAAAVWPTVNEKALARAFDRLDEQAVEFDQCQLEIADDRAEAACRGTARYVPSVGSRTPKVDARQWRFNLGRTAGRWTIVSVDAR